MYIVYITNKKGFMNKKQAMKILIDKEEDPV